MIARVLAGFILLFVLVGCGSTSGTTQAVKPRFHNSYYKKHVYYKHVRVGRVHLKLFEKQGVKTVKKN